MAELAGVVGTGRQARLVAMNLYCWPHRATHRFELVDVERIVYGLGLREHDAYLMARDDPDTARAMIDHGGPQCLIDVLLLGSDTEHVSQGIERRAASDA